jgi:hypothetical protein
VNQLQDVQAHKLLQFAEAFLVPIESWVNPQSRLVTPPFAAEFETRLQLHHATHSKHLGRVGLEDAVRAASIAAGRTVNGPMSATHRFIDEVIDGERIAIKSTAAQDLKEDFVHLSKVSEASWIQDMRGPQARAERTKTWIRLYMSEVDRLIQLRTFPDDEQWRYQLVEMPVSLLKPILEVDRSFFAADGPSVPVTDQFGSCMTFKIDRSDSKITFRKIPITRCIVHARWTLPKKPGDA